MAQIPKIGTPVRGSRTGRPVMVLLDLLGRRMALRLLWVLRDETRTFRALLEAAETNPAVLNARLAELKAAGLVGHDGTGYGLTADGRSLLALLLPLAEWAEAWAGTRAIEGAGEAAMPAAGSDLP
jgi:DNA-binding HxlR family transcriptional regulator